MPYTTHESAEHIVLEPASTADAAVIWLHGLGADGEAGVTTAIEIIRKELDVTMALCGHRDIRNIGRSILVPGTYPTVDPAPFLAYAAAPGAA